MGRINALTSVQLYYIENHFGKIPDKDLAIAVGLSVKQLHSVAKKTEPVSPPSLPAQVPATEISQVTGQPKRPSSPTSNLFARPHNPDGTVKQDSGITICTEAASQAADEMRSENASRTLAKNNKHIYRIKPV